LRFLGELRGGRAGTQESGAVLGAGARHQSGILIMEENLSELADARARAELTRDREMRGAKPKVKPVPATTVWLLWPLIPIPFILGVLGELAQLVAFYGLFVLPTYAIWSLIGILASAVLVSSRREHAKHTLLVNLGCFAVFAVLRIWAQIAQVSFTF
jgi:hypothetical protein